MDVLVTAVVVLASVRGALAFSRRKFGTPLGRTRTGVLKRIATQGISYSVNVPNGSAAWNPAHVRLNRYDPPLIYGKGQATYWRDDSDRVHLVFQPATGSARHLVAVVPPVVPGQHKWAVRAVAVTYVGLILGGFAIGYTAPSGDARDPVFIGFLGAMAGAASLSVLTLVFQVGRAVRAISHGPGPAAHARELRTADRASAAGDPGPVPEWVLADQEVRAQRYARAAVSRIPRPWPLALGGLLGIMVASFVADPLSNSGRVSTHVGDLIASASDLFGFGGVLLLVAALVCFVMRMVRPPGDG